MGCSKTGITITNTFQQILDSSGRKQCYIRSMKSLLEDNNIEIYSTHNEKKRAFVEKFIRILKNKVYNFNIKNVYIDKLDDIVNKDNNTYHRTIKMNPVNVRSSIYIDFNKKYGENPKFKAGDHVRILKLKEKNNF